MGNVIRDLWILTETGIVIFHREFDQKIEEQLFGGMLSALNSFAEAISEGGLSSFEIAGTRFSILKKKSCLIIANSSKNVKKKKVLNELGVIADQFCERFPEEFILNWNGDISLFESFEMAIKDSLESVKQFWSGI